LKKRQKQENIINLKTKNYDKLKEQDNQGEFETLIELEERQQKLKEQKKLKNSMTKARN
jgi:hypothetical protein